MPDPTSPSDSAAGPQQEGGERDGLAALQSFLCLEAPTLLPLVDPALSLDEHRIRLHQGLRELLPEAPPHELHPGLTARQAVEQNLLAARTALDGFFERQRRLATIDDVDRLLLYRGMLLTRAVDDFLKRAFDRKEISWSTFPSPQKGFRSTGQEAIVGAALPLRRPPTYPAGEDYRGDVIAPLIRDLGAALMFLDDPLHPILVQYGKDGTPVGGRDLHIGDLRYGVLPPSAPLAIATQTVIGLAYAWRLRGEERVAVSFIGDGGASLGEWHEAVNFAAVMQLPVVFVIENNQWALGTHVSEQTATPRFALRAAGYGIPGATLFGNDPEEIAAGVGWAAERARAGFGPTLLELVSYRRSGHAHHDDDRFHGSPGITGYELEAERRRWEAVDPIERYGARLLALGLADRPALGALAEEAEERVRLAAAVAASAPWPSPETYRAAVFAPRLEPLLPTPGPETATKPMSYDEAVRDGMVELMASDERVFVVGEDVGGRYGGAFGVTRGLAKRFGGDRCRNAPLAESAIVGCGVGAAIAGLRPIVEMQFADFLASGFNALVNNAAKLHWRWGSPLPLVVRLPYGGATGNGERLLGGGPFHSQCPEMWFVRTPGWKIVAPSTPRDAKGLLIAASRDGNPVLFLESKGLYGYFRPDLREEVPLGAGFEVPIGQASVRREGKDLTILTYGAMTWTALAAAEQLAGEGIDAEVVDLRTLVPLDEEAIARSVEKTNRVLLLHEDTRRGGFGAELAALLADRLFFHLDGPLRRVAAPDTPVPYSPPLEHDFLPNAEDVVREARSLLGV